MPDSATGKPIFLSVIVPAYNEEERLPSTIREIENYLAPKKFSWELIVIDDGSKDNTIAAAEREFTSPSSRVDPNPRNLGKGASVRRGMLLAKGKFRLFTDADNSTPIQETEKLITAMRERRCTVAIGSRALEGSQLEVRQPFYREMMGRFFNLIVQTLAIRGIYDTQCGFKIFTARAAEDVFPKQRMNGFSFDVEILMLARRAGHRITEVPVRWVNSPTSRVNPLKDSAKMFLDILRIRLGI